MDQFIIALKICGGAEDGIFHHYGHKWIGLF